MSQRSLFSRFIVWRVKHIQDSYFVIVLSVVVGLLAGLSAFLLKSFVYYIKELLTGFFDKSSENLWYILYPGVGIVITVFIVRYLLKDHTEHGIPRILYVISRLDGKMRWHKYFSHPFWAVRSLQVLEVQSGWSRRL